MDNAIRSESGHRISRRKLWRALLIAVVFAVAGTFIIVFQFFAQDVVELSTGSVAPQDIVAPRQFTYVSDIETDSERERARTSIPTRFSAPDPKVARQQVDRLRKIFDYLETVRADPYGSVADKFKWIAAIPDLNLSDTVIDQILIMDETAWAETRLEALSILDQAMRDEIKDSQVVTTRRLLPTKVALDTPDQQSMVIVDIVEDLIKPNTFPDEIRTEAERQAAVEAVEPVQVTVEENELIIRAGDIVDPRTLEKLDALQSNQPGFSWEENIIAPLVLMLLITVIISVYLIQYAPKILADSRRLILLVLFILAFIALAKVMIPQGGFVAYLYPMAALAMMIVILIDAQLAFILCTVLAFLAGYISVEDSKGLVPFLVLSGWTGALALGRGQRVSGVILAGIYVGAVNAGIAYVFNLSLEWNQVGALVLAGLLNGVLLSTGLALIGLLIIGNLFGITTSIQLTDLGRPTQPLLRQLLLKAPGTYHHSLMVSNLAEQAAERIGADSLLVRVMAYYHDIGKMQRPYFFIENQPPGMANVHERLDPQVSAQIIISHAKDGLDLAQKYRLPRAIKDGIAQHHGTSLVKFFYYQAAEAAKERGEEVDEAAFRYPGPRPQTRENGILMLADGSESAVRALKPRSTEEIEEIVQKIIAHHLNSGQLDECDLTIADLRQIRTAFVDILQGVHHPRIKYPEQIKAEEEARQTEERQAAEPEPADVALPKSSDSPGKTPPAVTPRVATE
ncbi:MAG: HDIG domain-containing protein [Anaerolineae bacterium]|nr:HDIG domain-containing protein [Anaerolineae bacterium]MCB0222219.1 HDIG domain-containing protein [Anaerolineae bacterium]